MNSLCCRILVLFVGAFSFADRGAGATTANTGAATATNVVVTKARYAEIYGTAGKEPVVEAKDLPRYPAVEPADAVKTIQVKKGFKVDLVASEPNIASPIAVSFDERGRMYVVEMIDYSERRDETPHLGRIRVLEDTKGTGRYDKATIFADNLPWPTGVICYDGGIFVASTPDIIWLKDTKRTGKADVREVVFTGFGTGLARLNVQALMNSFNWGLDNRIHLQSGSGNRGVIKCLKRRDLEPQELAARDFWFNPKTFDFGFEAGGGQYGFSYDNRGRKIVCNNSDHLRLFVYDERYQSRNPFFTMPPPLKSIAADGGAAEVFRLSPDEPWRIIRTRWRVAGVVPGSVEGGGRVSGYFTGATGTTVYRGDALGPDFVNNTFTGDAGGGLVHRKKLYPDGVSLIGRRPDDEQNYEFLASKDTWFRPVNFANAPDGSLYVIDMYREVIEHPWSIPTSIKQLIDLNSGHDRGRIYRVIPENFQQPKPARLATAPFPELVLGLEHPNGWQRDLAARLLFEKGDRACVPHLEKLIGQSKSPLARMRAYHVLDSLGFITELTLTRGFDDGDPAVREHAIRLAEHFIRQDTVTSGLWARLRRLSHDPDLRVRFQLALTLGGIKHVERASALADIVKRDPTDPWITAAVLSATPESTGHLLARLIGDMDFAHSANGESFLGQLLQVIGAKNDPVEVAIALSFVTSGNTSPVLVRALGDGLLRAGSSLAKADTAGKLKNIFARASSIAMDKAALETERTQAVALLGLTAFEESAGTLTACLSENQPPPVRLAAINALGRYSNADVSARLLHAFPEFSPPLRSAAMAVLLARADRALAVLHAVEGGQIKAGELSSTQTQFLQKHKDKRVGALAAKLFASQPVVPRDVIIRQFESAMTLKGDVAKGRAIYTERCVSCHRAEGQGNQLGPDLVTVKTAGREKLLTSILDPNREVAPQYLAYTIETKDDESYTGVIANDTPSGVTLRQAFGKEDTVPRAKIKKMSSAGQSLMPEGLEAALTPQQMADLLEFIENVK